MNALKRIDAKRGAFGKWGGSAVLLVMCLFMSLGVAQAQNRLPAGAEIAAQSSPEAVSFMQGFIAEQNPSLLIEDEYCATMLPWAIYRYSVEHEMDWMHLFVLAWQESVFDCHAKNPRDAGGAFGPFQIRRLWEPVIGDPRHRYYDPYLAVERVTLVLQYYLNTARYQELVERRFRYPLLCLYNTGEVLPVNMRYCRQVSSRIQSLESAWKTYQEHPFAQNP